MECNIFILFFILGTFFNGDINSSCNFNGVCFNGYTFRFTEDLPGGAGEGVAGETSLPRNKKGVRRCQRLG